MISKSQLLMMINEKNDNRLRLLCEMYQIYENLIYIMRLYPELISRIDAHNDNKSLLKMIARAKDVFYIESHAKEDNILFNFENVYERIGLVKDLMSYDKSRLESALITRQNT